MIDGTWFQSSKCHKSTCIPLTVTSGFHCLLLHWPSPQATCRQSGRKSESLSLSLSLSSLSSSPLLAVLYLHFASFYLVPAAVPVLDVLSSSPSTFSLSFQNKKTSFPLLVFSVFSHSLGLSFAPLPPCVSSPHLWAFFCLANFSVIRPQAPSSPVGPVTATWRDTKGQRSSSLCCCFLTWDS